MLRFSFKSLSQHDNYLSCFQILHVCFQNVQMYSIIIVTTKINNESNYGQTKLYFTWPAATACSVSLITYHMANEFLALQL